MKVRSSSLVYIPLDGIITGLLFWWVHPQGLMWMAIITGIGVYVARKAGWLWEILALCGLVLLLIGATVKNDDVAYAYMLAFGGAVFLAPILIGLYAFAKKRQPSSALGY